MTLNVKCQIPYKPRAAPTGRAYSRFCLSFNIHCLSAALVCVLLVPRKERKREKERERKKEKKGAYLGPTEVSDSMFLSANGLIIPPTSISKQG